MELRVTGFVKSSLSALARLIATGWFYLVPIRMERWLCRLFRKIHHGQKQKQTEVTEMIVVAGVLFGLLIGSVVSLCGGFKNRAKPWGSRVLLGIWAALTGLILFAYMSALVRGDENAEDGFYFLTNMSLAAVVGLTFWIYCIVKTRKKHDGMSPPEGESQ